MQNPLIIVHRSLRPDPAQRHTPQLPPPKTPQRTHPNPQPSSRTPRKRKTASLIFLVPQQKVQSRGKPHLGTREGRNSEKITPPHRIQPQQPASILGNIRVKKRFFKLFLKVRTDDVSLISAGMLFQIFPPLKQMDRKPYCRVFFARPRAALLVL